PLPLIAHIDVETGDVAASGHYVLVTRFDSAARSVQLFDGATLLCADMPLEAFQRSWTGFVVELPPPGDALLRTGISVGAVALAVLLLRRRRVQRAASVLREAAE